MASHRQYVKETQPSLSMGVHLTEEHLFYIICVLSLWGKDSDLGPNVSKKRTRQTRLETAVTHIHHRFGPRSLVKGGLPATLDTRVTFPHIPTGFSKLDKALGIGGLPKGRVSEVVGFPASGKTTLALKFLAQAQAAGGQVGYVDHARCFDPDYAYRCGLDLSRLVIGTPYGLDDTLAMSEALARSGGLSALVLDTVDFFWVGLDAAQQLTSFLHRLPAPLARCGTVLLFLHNATADESPASATLAHCATVRLQVVRERWQYLYGDVRGYEARVEVLKNRLGPAGRAVTIAIQFNGTVHGDGL